ncbi:DeoR/GlpR family DNA-binding transcription regulator [Radiobacillus kanasensis]|uniref:DeoR/GlpR family DNA-binding transcription regulator n=1 Tax=Radiobacillus kanasensis TaxID=2844358 RepID=UPI001E2A7E8C|nr:DeoR/GlpR family DNA-binding transcription regulator [Radiobacillus kanasensis]UFU01188.1 DeoR/GlpR family DNA-binding transcription regulator [Radiobacillus kanasensis]
MYQEERLISIMNYLEQHKRISVEKICDLFEVSRDTARRDLVKLEEQGDIVRTRGGAIFPTSPSQPVANYARRLQVGSDQKRQIGKKAADLILPGDKVILDASTTVQSCAEQIGPVPCTIITNSINQADILSSNTVANIFLLGGTLEKQHRFLYGASVLDKLSNYYVDKAFIGVVGISEQGLTIAQEEDGMVKRKVIQQAKQVIVLADYTKIGVTDFYQFATLDEIDLLITDETPDKYFTDLLKANNVELLVTNDHV